MEVRESQIEDVLATYPDVTKGILGLAENLTLLAKQKILPSGNKLDLLFVSGTKLILIELKVEAFQKSFIPQVIGYRNELQQLQSMGKLVHGNVDSYLLCPLVTQEEKEHCLVNGVTIIQYSPADVLDAFYARLRKQADFIMMKPADHGLWGIHLLNRLLYAMDGTSTKAHLSLTISLSKSTIGSYLRFAQELQLVKRVQNDYMLTEIGREYVKKRDKKSPEDYISDEQTKAIQESIIKDPFASRVIFGIYTLVNVVFELARNTYPVPLDVLIRNFRDNAGKLFDWVSPKSASDGTKMYSNYAIELGLIGKVGDKHYLTPEGVRFILLLQLHKAMQIVDSLRVTL